MAGNPSLDEPRARLQHAQQEMEERLERITGNVRRGLDSDSEERAKQLEDADVVDALGNETRAAIAGIKRALQRIDDGSYGVCVACGDAIMDARLRANPAAESCIDCAELEEESISTG